MCNNEFAARVFLEISEKFPELKQERFEETVFSAVERVRGIEREEYSRRMIFLENRHDIHPVCKM
jgi:hypothetical protein